MHADRAKPAIVDLRQHGGAVARLAALTIAGALTEGVGLVLIIPILSVLGAAGEDPGTNAIAKALTMLGVPLALGPMLALFVGVVALRALLNHARAMAALRLQVRVVDGLRRRLWSALLHCDWRVLVTMRRAENAGLLITSIDRVGTGLGQGLIVLTTLATLGGLGLAGLAISAPVTLAAALAGGLVLFGYRGMRRRAMRIGEQLSSAYSAVHSQLGESMAALRVIKSFGREAAAETEAMQEFAQLRGAMLAYQRDGGLSQVALQAGGALVLAVIVWLAIARWHFGAMTILPLVALFARALPLLGALQQSWQYWSHSRPAARDALALIVRAEAGREPGGGPEDDAVAPPALTRAIELSGVSVRFAESEPAALDSVELILPARGITALVGSSGAGKSTLADLLGGLIAPDSGTISIDGVALAGPLRRAWRHRVAYVQQEPVLFSGTIRDNLRWADPQADDAKLLRALDRAAAHFVAALPNALDTVIGDGGRQFSGGERQRLVLARALLRDPALLILDEATSALDAANEAAVAAALEGLRDRLAVLVICHRGALADMADRVVRLEAGRIVEPSGQ